MTVIHGGDFQQILPIIIKGSREHIVDASLQQSYLWNLMQVIYLHQNMRLERSTDESNFAKWLLDVGHGRNMTTDNCVTLPHYMVTTSLSILLTDIYGDMVNLPHAPPPIFFCQRAILMARNVDVFVTNTEILHFMPGSEKVFFSADTIISEDSSPHGNQHDIPIEYLHSLQPAALPPSELRVKEGCPLILLHNLSPSCGLCNGTRLILLCAQPHILEVRILGGDHDGKNALIPHISLIPSTEEGYTFQFKRHQFPVRLAFAMTINKAEGQSLHTVGIDLRTPIFSHGQLYVALSRATHPVVYISFFHQTLIIKHLMSFIQKSY